MGVVVTGPRDLRGGSEAMGPGWGQGGDRWRDLKGGGTCRRIPSPRHGASLRDRISPTGTARCARAPSPRLGSGRAARVRGATEPSGCVSAQSQGRRAAAGRDAVLEGRGSQGRGPRELTAGRFVHPSVTASVRWPVGASGARAPRAVRGAGRGGGVEGRA